MKDDEKRRNLTFENVLDRQIEALLQTGRP